MKCLVAYVRFSRKIVNFGVFIVDFEQVNAGWDWYIKSKRAYKRMRFIDIQR